uniref:Survival protein SurE-like phosphatase/nucleotidase domain-containing protein n=2 Tax=Rhodosorus marinus TaxID=101924 RepID=A0A7S3EHV4_9RHOD|mmetsp:Transcript_33770/g.132736  ORF Transcript_33770/g.132736 Transcript_33770/m.132736 type:complete len:289 (+) Transcript_33770:566-1432(+)
MNKVAMGGTACFVEVILLRSKVSSRQFVRLAASRAMGPWRRVLLTNDDGYASPALLKLREALEKGEKVETTVVAPNSNQSACGQRLTLTGRMDLTNHCEIGQRVYSITGSPSDCAILALDPGGIMHDPPPTLVVSGINLGSNMSHDVLYSGTFAGARQAAMLGYPAIATSLAGDDFSEKSLAAAVDATMSITHRLLEILPIRPENPSRQELKRQPHNMYANSSACEDINMAVFHAFRCGDIVLNVNTPCKWSGNFQCTSLAAIAYRDTVQRDNHEVCRERQRGKSIVL